MRDHELSLGDAPMTGIEGRRHVSIPKYGKALLEVEWLE